MSKTVFELIAEHGLKGLRICDKTWEDGEYVKFHVKGWIDEDGNKYTMDGAESMFWELYVEPKEYWINVYSDELCHKHNSREEADRNATPTRVACIKVKEGEGL